MDYKAIWQKIEELEKQGLYSQEQLKAIRYALNFQNFDTNFQQQQNLVLSLPKIQVVRCY